MLFLKALVALKVIPCANRAVYIVQDGVIKYAWEASPNPGVEPDYDEIKNTLQNL